MIGIDLGKHSFHLHGQDRVGKVVFRKKVSREQLLEFFATFHPCTAVMEACAGAHWMARKLREFGHAVKLISPQFVRPFVKSNKNDFVDAEAICEACVTTIDEVCDTQDGIPADTFRAPSSSPSSSLRSGMHDQPDAWIPT